MKPVLKIGIIGDFDPDRHSHRATNESLNHAATALSASIESIWLPTPVLDKQADEEKWKAYDAYWCSPGSPYKNLNGALKAIRFCREHDWPFIGT